MKKYYFFTVLIIAAFITACSDVKEKKNTNPKEEVFISADSLTDKFIDYWNKYDTVSLSEIFATNAIVLLNNGNFVGHDTIINFWVKEQVSKTKNLQNTKVLSETSCNIACYAGNLKLDFVKNNEILDSGEITFSLIWKKQDDNTWKIELLHLATIGDKQKKEQKEEKQTENKKK